MQALTTLNDPAYLDAARGLADRMQKEGGAAPAARILYGVRLCLARKPRPAELSRLTALYNQELRRYQANIPAAQKLTNGAALTPDAAEKAAWIVVANVLLNLDETLTKE